MSSNILQCSHSFTNICGLCLQYWTQHVPSLIYHSMVCSIMLVSWGREKKSCGDTKPKTRWGIHLIFHQGYSKVTQADRQGRSLIFFLTLYYWIFPLNLIKLKFLHVNWKKSFCDDMEWRQEWKLEPYTLKWRRTVVMTTQFSCPKVIIRLQHLYIQINWNKISVGGCFVDPQI